MSLPGAYYLVSSAESLIWSHSLDTITINVVIILAAIQGSLCPVSLSVIPLYVVAPLNFFMWKSDHVTHHFEILQQLKQFKINSFTRGPLALDLLAKTSA